MKQKRRLKFKNVCGGRIRLMRLNARKALSQQELAQKLWNMGLDIDRSAISRIESQQRQVSDFELMGIAYALGVTTNDLVEAEDSRRYFQRLTEPERAVAEDIPLGLLPPNP